MVALLTFIAELSILPS